MTHSRMAPGKTFPAWARGGTGRGARRGARRRCVVTHVRLVHCRGKCCRRVPSRRAAPRRPPQSVRPCGTPPRSGPRASTKARRLAGCVRGQDACHSPVVQRCGEGCRVSVDVVRFGGVGVVRFRVGVVVRCGRRGAPQAQKRQLRCCGHPPRTRRRELPRRRRRAPRRPRERCDCARARSGGRRRSRSRTGRRRPSGRLVRPGRPLRRAWWPARRACVLHPARRTAAGRGRPGARRCPLRTAHACRRTRRRHARGRRRRCTWSTQGLARRAQAGRFLESLGRHGPQFAPRRRAGGPRATAAGPCVGTPPRGSPRRSPRRGGSTWSGSARRGVSCARPRPRRRLAPPCSRSRRRTGRLRLPRASRDLSRDRRTLPSPPRGAVAGRARAARLGSWGVPRSAPSPPRSAAAWLARLESTAWAGRVRPSECAAGLPVLGARGPGRHVHTTSTCCPARPGASHKLAWVRPRAAPLFPEAANSCFPARAIESAKKLHDARPPGAPRPVGHQGVRLSRRADAALTHALSGVGRSCARARCTRRALSSCAWPGRPSTDAACPSVLAVEPGVPKA